MFSLSPAFSRFLSHTRFSSRAKVRPVSSAAAASPLTCLEPENIAPKIQSDFEPEQKDIIDKQRRKQKRRELKLKRIAAAAAGWLLMAWMIYLMAVTARTVPNIWDPYEILGLSRVKSGTTLQSKQVLT